MERYIATLGADGRLELPEQVRSALGAKQDDKIIIEVDDDGIRLSRSERPLLPGYRSIPPLKTPLTDEEVTEMAADEAVLDFLRERA